MKVSLNWLREFVELPPTVEELADLLTLAGVEVEGIEKRGANSTRSSSRRSAPRRSTRTPTG